MSKYILKLGLFFIIFLMMESIEAQGQRGGQSQGRPQGQSTMPQFNAENAAGILTYKSKRVIKKTKLKKAEDITSVERIILEYNQSIDAIKLLHADQFRATEGIVAEKQKEAMANRDRDAMRSIQRKAMQQLRPIRSKVLNAEKELNAKLELVFTEKQNTKWLKYQETKKQGLKPQNPNNTNAGRSGGRQGNF